MASAVPTMPAAAGVCIPSEIRLKLSNATQLRRKRSMCMKHLQSMYRLTLDAI
jgi:hypothetical protein